jgi:hypothetical protein
VGVQSLSGAQLLACKEERAASGKAHVTVVGGNGFSVTIGLDDARLTSLQGKPKALQHQRRRRCMRAQPRKRDVGARHSRRRTAALPLSSIAAVACPHAARCTS